MPTGTWWVEARDAAQHPTVYRMPQHREWSPNVVSAQVEVSPNILSDR